MSPGIDGCKFISSFPPPPFLFSSQLRNCRVRRWLAGSPHACDDPGMNKSSARQPDKRAVVLRAVTLLLSVLAVASVAMQFAYATYSEGSYARLSLWWTNQRASDLARLTNSVDREKL
jgi:hypothetical protein